MLLLHRLARVALGLAFTLFLTSAAGISARSDPDSITVVGCFSEGDLDQWNEKSFVGNTRYALKDSERGKVLTADTEGNASGLFKEIKVDLNKTPYLNWSWLVQNTFEGNNERTKAGDDYPARIYVVVSGGVFFWNTRAVNYVWSSHQTVGSQWNNAYTDNARMLAVRSGGQDVGNWFTEKRNVREDFKRMFGKDIDHIDAIAVMVDGDNTGQSASAEFGDIFFSAN